MIETLIVFVVYLVIAGLLWWAWPSYDTRIL